MTLTEIKIAERKDRIIKCAIDCFSATSIESTTMAQIAKAAKVGEASMYRYFSNKTEVLTKAATMVWNKAAEDFQRVFSSEELQQKTGIEQIRFFIGVFIDIHVRHSHFMAFAYNFDVYALKHGIDKTDISKCKKELNCLSHFFFDAVKKGEVDGSISTKINIEDLYYTVLNTMVIITQKLAIYRDVLNSTDVVNSTRQIEVLIELLVRGIESESCLRQ